MQSLIKFIIAVSLLPIVASAESIPISRKTSQAGKAASDLVDETGKFMSPAAATLMSKKKDLSLVNPMPDKMWAGRQKEVIEYFDEQGKQQVTTTPGWGSGDNSISLDAMYSSAKYIATEKDDAVGFHARVESLARPGLIFRMGLSKYSHSAMMRSALLRKLGYIVPVLQYYKSFNLQFDSEEAKQSFLDSAEGSMGIDIATENNTYKWILKDDKNAHTVTLSNIVAEPIYSDVFDISWGYAPRSCKSEECGAQKAALERLNQYRTYRALLIPYILVDIPESINLFSPAFGTIERNKVILTHEFAASFFTSTGGITYADARWILRKIAALTNEDLNFIVKNSGLDSRFHELVKAKLIHRINHALVLFGLKSLQKFQNPELSTINSADGVVVNGKVEKNVQGYPLRYFYGERKSPKEKGDEIGGIKIDAKSSVLQNAINKVTDKLKILDVDDAINNRKKEMQKRILNHIKNHPDRPLTQDIEAWGGPLLGFDASASRHVSTGAYYESSAPAQLVDELSLSANLGYFWIVDGIKNATPTMGVQISKTRTYAHVRPLTSLKNANDKSWKDLYVPGFMKNLAKILDKPATVSKGDVELHPTDAFLQELQPGEVFIITDSLVKAGYAQVSIPLTQLLGLDPVNFASSIAFGTDLSRVQLNQTVITKDMKGTVQIYHRNMRSTVPGLTFDVSYFIKLLSFREQATYTDIHTDAFLLDYAPGAVEAAADGGAEKNRAKLAQKNLRLALKGLFKKNDPDLLFNKFMHRRVQVDHDLDTTDKFKAKFLSFNKNHFTEDHEVTLKLPGSLFDSKDITDPEKFELLKRESANESITLYSSKYGSLSGSNHFNLIFDFIDGFLAKKGNSLYRSETENPADMPFGKAKWKIITTEVDITKETQRRKQLQSVLLYKRIWGGWSMKQDDFFRIIDEINNELAGIADYQVIDKQKYYTTKSVDFFRYTMSLSLLQSGLDSLKKIVVGADENGQPQIYARVMSFIGNGNFENGEKKYMQSCKLANNRSNQKIQAASSTTHNGIKYDCLTSWMKELIELSNSFPQSDKKAQAAWYTNVMKNLESNVPLNALLNRIGSQNYVLVVGMNGFMNGNEAAGAETDYSNSVGDVEDESGRDIPADEVDGKELINGLFQYYANLIGLSSSEVDRTQGGFQ